MTQAEQFDAILHGAAIAPITDRAFLRIAGADATRWLNGMVTNSIQSLAPGEGNYNFLLNAQGRIQGDCTIYREPIDGDAAFLLATDRSQVEAIHLLLDKFIIMDDVELSEAMPGQSGLLLLGPGATKRIEALDGSALAPLRMSLVRSGNDTPSVLLSPQSGVVPQFEIFGPAPFQFAATTEVSAAALEAFRVYSGVPRYGTDIRNSDAAKDLPQETAQTHALHFAKGCYLGQEIVERIRSRGQVHRTFSQFTLIGDLPSLPAPLTVDGKPAGELTSAALVPLPEGDTLMALGYIRREFLTATITYPGGAATLRTPKS